LLEHRLLFTVIAHEAARLLPRRIRFKLFSVRTDENECVAK
jgi:hypothetical protein